MTPYPGAMSVTPGTMTPGFATSTRIDLNQIGEARNSMLGIKLDQVQFASNIWYTYIYTTRHSVFCLLYVLNTMLGF